MPDQRSARGILDPSVVIDLERITTRRPSPRFLIVLLALFVCCIEVVATVSLKFLLDASSPHAGYMVFFLIAFPSLLSLLFFFTLWLRRESRK